MKTLILAAALLIMAGVNAGTALAACACGTCACQGQCACK